VRRRDFIQSAAALSAIALPSLARAQQRPTPVIGFLDSRSADAIADRLSGFRDGLQDSGFEEDKNVEILYRFAENRGDRLPELAAELVRRRVAVIVATSPPAALATKAATASVPTVFVTGDDPVKLGLVTSVARPEANLTGINFLVVELAAKRLELLRELVPKAERVAMLVDPRDPVTANQVRDLEAAAAAIGLKIQKFDTSSAPQTNSAFEEIGRGKHDAVFVGTSAFLNSRAVQLAQLSAFYRLPSSFGLRSIAEAGGLMSYGSDIVDAYRHCGLYVGRILKGERVASLPIVQASKFELVINQQTARMLGISVTSSFLARADRIID
jgi:putative tryptophan/tyrosine transport system substrate-binding protein